jgi:thiamine transport system ATP-binding protein
MITVDHIDVEIAGSTILSDVSFALETGGRLAVLGPSGSGKSTLLRTIAGLHRPTRGRILSDGIDVTDRPAHARGIGFVFQDGALFPHRDVGRNVGYGLEVAGLSRDDADARVAEVLELVGLPGLARRSVTTLSGGEAQRVGLARALAPAPRSLLLDEPLGALDGPLRERLKEELRALFERLELTVVHVTHDVTEAFAIGDRVALIRRGSIAQLGTPHELWSRPADDWVAELLGMQNIFRRGTTATVIRPEAIRLTPGTGARILRIELRGATAAVHVRREDDGAVLEAVVPTLDVPMVGRAGAEVAVTVARAGVLEVPVWSDGAAARTLTPGSAPTSS